MAEITLNAETRQKTGKGLYGLRKNGKVPGIYYAHGQKNIPIAIQKTLLKPLYTRSTANIINLKLEDGTSRLCILKDIQFDPITDEPLHFDLFGLNENEELTIEVPIILTGGTPKGVKEGGILQHVLHRIKVSCLPKNIPDHIEVNVENLGINRSIHIKDLSIPNVRILENEASTIVSIIPPAVSKEQVEAQAATAEQPAAEASAEPEVISKGKKSEEGSEEEEKKK